MDWIERWFGVSPDGGDGSLEILIAVVLVVIGVSLCVAAWVGTRTRRRRVGSSAVPGK